MVMATEMISTCSLARATIFDILIQNGGVLSTSQITDFLNVSRPTALRTMTELKATGLVNMHDDVGYHNSGSEIHLKSEFGWFLSDTFTELRNDHKEKCTPPHYNPILLLLYYSSINKKICLDRENSLQSNERLCGGKILYGQIQKKIM
jgi:hypothetical protein